MENLCPSYKSILDSMFNLKNEGRTKNVWTSNGVVHFKYTDNPRERAKKVFHKKDIDIFFVDHDGKNKNNNIASGNM